MYHVDGLGGLFTGERHAIHGALVAVVIIQGVVLRAAIIPECERALFPVKAALKLFALLHAIEILQQRTAFIDAHSINVGGVSIATVQGLTSRLWGGADDRMT